MGKDISVKEFNNLLKRIAKGDDNAFKKFYELFDKFIYSTAFRITSSKVIIEEVVDDVMVKIWNAAPNQNKIDNPFGWIYTITVNCAKDRLKSKKTYEEIFDIPDNDKNISDFEANESFHSMLACLSDEEERIVKLHLEEDYTFKEIARIEKSKPSTISSIYYKAIEKVGSTIKIS